MKNIIKLGLEIIIMLILTNFPVFASQDIYRVYNPNSGEHIYTVASEEVSDLTRNHNWNDEGTGWIAPSEDEEGAEAIYRLYNPILGWHLYTVDTNEVSTLINGNGWVADFSGNPIFYSGGTIPVYRLYDPNSGNHHLTMDKNEYNTLPNYGWVQEGIKLYAKTSESNQPSQPSQPSQPQITNIELFSNEKFLQVQDGEPILFTAKVNQSTENLYLYNQNDNTQLGKMHDDGIDGDTKADDKIYSFQLSNNITQPGSRSFIAKNDDNVSNIVNITFFASNPSNTELETSNNLTKSIEEINEKYEDSNDNVSNIKDALTEAEEFLKQQLQQGNILEYRVNSDNIIYKDKSGLTHIYQPNVNVLNSGGTPMRITVMRPFVMEQYNTPDISPYLDACRETPKEILNHFDNYTYSVSSSAGDTIDDNFENDEASLDNIINRFTSNSIILWDGHGGFDSEQGSCLGTGTEFADAAAANEGLIGKYNVARVRGYIMYGDTSHRVSIFPKFVDYYCGSMNNSLILMTSCHSGDDSRLADSFINKGARAVLGWNDSVYTEYADQFVPQVLHYMTELNDSDQFKNLSEAVDDCKKEFKSKDTDMVWGKLPEGKSGPSEAQLFGDTNFRLSDSNTNPIKETTISGKVVEASDGVTPIPNALIHINQFNGESRTEIADSNGEFSCSLSGGNYQININEIGYLPLVYNYEVNVQGNNYLEKLMLVKEGEGPGTIHGKITSSLTGEGLSDVTLIFRKNWNNKVEGNIESTITTTSDGSYEVTLPAGYYTMEVSKRDYITTFKNIISQPTELSSQNASITPLGVEGVYTAVLEWGENPRDLDSHLVGTLSNDEQFHLYFQNKNVNDDVNHSIFNLDVDCTDGKGPETVSLSNIDPNKTYYYYVHKYAGSGSIATSNASVSIAGGAETVGTFHAPTDQGDGLYWNVFAIKNGQLIARNTITSTPELNYAD